jgi:hypothetical protein
MARGPFRIPNFRDRASGVASAPRGSGRLRNHARRRTTGFLATNPMAANLGWSAQPILDNLGVFTANAHSFSIRDLKGHPLQVPKKDLQNDLPRSRLARRAQALLGNRFFPGLAALLAAALALPALRVGWILDDYYHRAVLLETSPFRDLFGPPANMFRFFHGDPERTSRVMDLGFFPWWTYPGIKAEFLQWLTVQTHRLDYWLWPNSAVAMHAQSLLWFAMLVALAAFFYRRIITPGWVAGLAALLFAIDPAHGTPAGWLANRNSLVAGCFGILTLIFHDQFRRDGRRASCILALLALTAALLAKEEGIATCAYLLAYGIFLDSAGRWRGCLALIPYLGIVILWRALRAAGGYGVWDIGLYVDPLNNPVRFGVAVVERLPVLLLAQLGLPPSDIAMLLSPTAKSILWWSAILFLTAFLFVMAPLLRNDKSARFWAAGMLFSAIPVCATFPMDRLLTFVGIGAFGLIAQLFHAVLDPAQRRAMRARYRVPAIVLALFFVAVHAVFAPIALPFRAGNPLGPKALMDRFEVKTPLGPSVQDQSVVIVNAPSAPHACYLPIQRGVSGLPVPRHTRVLASGMPSVTIRRLSKNVLVVRPEKGYLDWVADRLFRGTQHPLALGEKVELTGMTVEITALTEDGRPAEAAFQFSVPLEDPSLLWLCYRGKTFEPFRPPAIGESVEIRIGGLLGGAP